ncbi:MAG: hypothetical protein QOD99_963 [Chthoniobacter sp.]|jgi:hypothetical protein|nr:hypothetical protein [Chthoniobacter sp.]
MGKLPRWLSVALLVLSALPVPLPARAAEELIVHEWGTFTSLQDEWGNTIGGINTDDEPVPDFVKDVARMLLIKPGDAPPNFFQGAPSCHPDVTMRLETPVLYFHSATRFNKPVTVQVAFQGGWLTQFFPGAMSQNPGINPDAARYGSLGDKTKSTLEWKDLRLSDHGTAVATDMPVWLKPRMVNASFVQTTDDEAEKFLFYRGVAHLDAPVVVKQRDGKVEIAMRDRVSARLTGIGGFWYVDIRQDQTAAFRWIAASDAKMVTTEAAFAENDYGEIAKLKSEMHTALKADGLFADEATALLDTWELSYFKSAGRRLFFLVPEAWTNEVLPLSITPQCQIKRVMVGRVEMVTPEQRRFLAKIAAGPIPNSWDDVRQPLEKLTLTRKDTELWNNVLGGKTHLADVPGYKLHPTYASYLDLGRFRNALILEEQKRHPSENVDQFIKNFGLNGYAPTP